MYLNGTLIHSKTFEEEINEAANVEAGIQYLEKLGITVKTNYGYFRNAYDIIHDLGEKIRHEKI